MASPHLCKGEAMNDQKSIEERLYVLERLLLLPLNYGPSPSERPQSILLDSIGDLHKRLHTLEKERIDTHGQLKAGMQECQESVQDCQDIVADHASLIDDLENAVSTLRFENGINGKEVTAKVKHYIRLYLRNSLGLEVNSTDKAKGDDHPGSYGSDTLTSDK